MPIESGWSRTSTDGKWINLNTKSQVNNTISFSVAKATLESQMSICQSVRQSVCQSVHQSVCQSVRQSVRQSVHQSVRQSVCQSVHQFCLKTANYEHLKVVCGWVVVGVFGL